MTNDSFGRHVPRLRQAITSVVAGVVLVVGAMAAIPALTTAANAVTSADPCPAIGQDTIGCALIITIDSSGGVSVSPGPNIGMPYDGVEDTLIGVVNNSSQPISSLALSSALNIFGFDGDGICTYTFSGYSYCTSAQQSQTNNDDNHAAGLDYQGPDNTWTVASSKTGAVNFTPPLGAGGNTYFSLEEPLKAGDITFPTHLVIAKTSSGSFTYAGQGHYSLAVSNTGGATSGTVTVSDTLPAGESFVSGSGNDGFTCAAVSQVVTCSTSTVINFADPATINLVVNLSASAGTSLNNTATAKNGNDTATSNTTTNVVGQYPLVITASSPSVAYGSKPPAITASYSLPAGGAALTTAPKCSTTATSSSNVGSYPSKCTGAVGANYAISYVNGSVNVAQYALVITASSGSMVYHSTPPAITASYTLPTNGAALTTAPTCSTTAMSSSAVGSYATSCSDAASPDYTITYVNGSVNVTPYALVITASSPSIVYGSTPPAITASYSLPSGGAALTTAPTCSTTATSSSGVGSYATSCVGAVGSDYAISYVNGAVNVTSYALVITASSGSMVYGSTPPAITASYTLPSGGAALATAPTCSTTETSSSNVGSYVSSCSGAASPNYTISYVAGNVTVTPAPAVTVSASSIPFTAGQAVPTVTCTSSVPLTTPAAGTTAASSFSLPGTYATNCTGAVDANYAGIVYAPGTATVLAAPAVAVQAHKAVKKQKKAKKLVVAKAAKAAIAPVKASVTG